MRPRPAHLPLRVVSCAWDGLGDEFARGAVGVQRWSVEHVLALAPDASSASAGQKLANTGQWSGTGASEQPAALWGFCQGSGANPYQLVVDLAGPAYKCSCPSRKFPCKHTLALLVLWATDRIGADPIPAQAADWLQTRADKAVRAQEARTESAADDQPTDPVLAERRAAQRAARVAAGLDELDQWLRDQVRTGIAGSDRAGYRLFAPVAARMVDAQAGAVATTLKSLPAITASGEGWPAQLLEEYSLLRLLVTAHRNLDNVPPDLAAVIRRRVGYGESKADVLATPAVRDHWSVLAMRDTQEDRLSARRIWMQGRTSGRTAMVLSYGATGQPLDSSVVVGTTLDADLHFYPGAQPIRAVVGERYGPLRNTVELTGVSVTGALEAYARALAADPWLTGWPMVLAGVVPVPVGDRWVITDADAALPCERGTDLWCALAVSGGRPIDVVCEVTAHGVRLLTARSGDGSLVTL